MKVNTNILIVSCASIIVALIGGVVFMSVNGVDSSALASVMINLTSAMAPLVAILAVFAKVNRQETKLNEVNDKTDKMLNGVMDGKIVAGTTQALQETGVVDAAQHITTAATTGAETPTTPEPVEPSTAVAPPTPPPIP